MKERRELYKANTVWAAVEVTHMANNQPHDREGDFRERISKLQRRKTQIVTGKQA